MMTLIATLATLTAPQTKALVDALFGYLVNSVALGVDLGVSPGWIEDLTISMATIQEGRRGWTKLEADLVALLPRMPYTVPEHGRDRAVYLRALYRLSLIQSPTLAGLDAACKGHPVPVTDAMVKALLAGPPPARPDIPKSLTCGCCTNGCTCENHQDTPNGKRPGPCEYHAVLPYAPLDKGFRYDVRIGDYVRVPQGAPIVPTPDHPGPSQVQVQAHLEVMVDLHQLSFVVVDQEPMTVDPSTPRATSPEDQDAARRADRAQTRGWFCPYHGPNGAGPDVPLDRRDSRACECPGDVECTECGRMFWSGTGHPTIVLCPRCWKASDFDLKVPLQEIRPSRGKTMRDWFDKTLAPVPPGWPVLVLPTAPSLIQVTGVVEAKPPSTAPATPVGEGPDKASDLDFGPAEPSPKPPGSLADMMRRQGVVCWTYEGQEYTSVIVATCPLCQVRAVIRLPPEILALQPDDTTHVCHLLAGGCNHGFSDLPLVLPAD